MYRIVVDSCGELTPEMIVDTDHFASVPLTISVGGKDYLDDENFDQGRLIAAMAASSEAPHSACPSPAAYMEKLEEVEADHYYSVTLSSQLSGSYNAAVLAGNLMREEWEDDEVEGKYYHAFNSKSASIGETLIGRKIAEYEEAHLPFEEIIEKVDAYIESQVTWFVLESLDTLRKNGRLSNFKAFVATALKIKPICTSTPEGEIQQVGQARGINKALVKMVEMAAESAGHMQDNEIAVSHTNNPERGQMVLDAIRERVKAKNYFLENGRGCTSMYANDGGIIMVL